MLGGSKTIVAAALVLCALGGCMSPERAERVSDEKGNAIVEAYSAQVTGNANSFSIARPSDRLRNLLLARQGLDPGVAEELRSSLSTNLPPLPDPLVLSLVGAMKAGAANDNKFQLEKEKLFSTALDLDAARHEFDATFAGVFGVTASGDDNGGGEEGDGGDSAKFEGKMSLKRKFANGATLVASVGLDIVRLLTGGGTSRSFLGDASVTIPLLRGAGAEIVREPLTQAERNMIYAVHNFEDYRQSYVLEVARAYYEMLQVEQKLRALGENQKRMTDNFNRSRMLFEAGRMSQVDLDQTRQNLLSTKNSLVASEQSMQTKLDSFKISLGLPVDARVALDMTELDRIESLLANAERDKDGGLVQPKLAWTEEAAIAAALTNNHKVVVARLRLDDADRALAIARDNLRGELSVTAGASTSNTSKPGGESSDSLSWNGSVKSDLPWDRTAERIAYRKAQIAVDVAKRDFDTLLDSTKQLIREDIRSVNSAWSSYVIRVEALAVAERRVKSATLFLQAGKSSTRDMLEAEAALLDARDNMVSAIVDYRMANLKLLRDMSLLHVSEEGILIEDK